MQVSTDEIRFAVSKILEHLECRGQTKFDIEDDFYWSVPSESRYDTYDPPSNLTLGQLSEDWIEIRAILSEEKEPVGYALVWLSKILERIGEKAIG